MEDTRGEYTVGLDSNVASNEYLRCLWFLIRKQFGKLAWNFIPTKIADKKTIIVGNADVGLESPLSISVRYEKRGCLSSVSFSKIPSASIKNKLIRCLKEAVNYNEYLSDKRLICKLSKFIDINYSEGTMFSIKGNDLSFSLASYDKEDGIMIAKDMHNSLCSILTFYLLTPVNPTNDQLFYGKHKKINLELPEQAIQHIDNFLSKKYAYENNLTLFETAIDSFSQGIIYETLSLSTLSDVLPFVESAIVSYMSALEIISTNDRTPTQCQVCGQMRYSIARRVQDLVAKTLPGYEEYMAKWIRMYYKIRSEYIHTGKKLSMRNYSGVSIPLLSIYNNTGMINQKQIVSPDIKYIVRNAILSHEGKPLILSED